MKKPVEFDSAGQRVRGMFYLAEGELPLPTVLLLRGFPAGEGDVLLGQRMAQLGINTLTFSYRGTGESEGTFSLRNVQQDIHAALTTLHQEGTVRAFKVDTGRLILGGVSFGGGMAFAYAVNHPEIKRIFSIAGDDYGAFARQYQRNPAFAARIDGVFEALWFPSGPVRFAGKGVLEELTQDPAPYDLRLNAAALANRDILLIGGWDDLNVTIEGRILPFYRALVDAGAQNVQIVAFQDDHTFETSREELAALIIRWVESP